METGRGENAGEDPDWLLSVSEGWFGGGGRGVPAYGEMVILVPVSCSIFFRFRPSFPINLPTKLLCASIFSGISSVLHEDKRRRTVTVTVRSSVRVNVK